MSSGKSGEGNGCCSSAARCMFGYFPWVPLLGCTAVSVFMVFWKLWLDPLASKTKTFLRASGIDNGVANSFLDRTTLITSVVLIVTLVIMAALLLLAIFKGHQRALHDAVYGQGQMPGRYYWLHLFFGMLLSALLYILIISFIAVLVGLTLWLAGAIAAETAAYTAARVYTANANHAMALDDTNSILSSELQKLNSSLTPADSTLVSSALDSFLVQARNVTYPLQGQCRSGCLDLSILSDAVDVQGTCKCSRGELFQLGQLAGDLKNGLFMPMGSIGLAIGVAMLLLMNISSRITDSKRDLRDIRTPEEVPVMSTKLMDEESAMRTDDTSSKQSTYTAVSNGSSRRIMPVSASPEKSHMPLPQTMEPRHAYSHSHNQSDSSLPSTNSYAPVDYTTAVPPNTSKAAQPPLPPSTMSYTGHTPASWDTPLRTAAAMMPSSSNMGSTSSSVDLRDGWKAIAARYEKVEEQAK